MRTLSPVVAGVLTMKPHNGILLMLVYGIFGTAAQEHSPECACIDPWLAGLHGSNSNNRNSDCAFQAGADGDGICYSGSYGLGCRAHDQTQDTCIGEQRPKWCDLRWCWVDPRTCLRPHDSSSFFPNASIGNLESATPLSYSYETCGNLNFFNDRQREALSRFGEMVGRPIRVSFPTANAGNGYFLVTLDDGESSRYNGTRRAGSYVALGDRVLRASGLDWVEVPLSNSSKAFSPGSSYTACCHEVAIGNADICFSNTWATPARRVFVSFTSEIDVDEFLLVVFGRDAGSNSFSWSSLKIPFEPFSPGLWGLIVLMCFYVGIAYFAIEFFWNEDQFSNRNLLNGFNHSLFISLHAFLSGGDFHFVPRTSAGKFVFTTFAFAVLVLVASYTATVTTNFTLDSQRSIAIKSLETGIEQGARFCGLDAIKEAMFARYPRLAPLWSSFPTAIEMLRAMGEGSCQAIIITRDNWRNLKQLDEEGAGPHCVSKVALDNPVFYLSNAMPVSPDLQQSMSWAMTSLITQGIYEEIKQQAIEEFTEDSGVCGISAVTEQQVSSQLGVANGSGAIVITFLITTSAIIYHFLCEVLRWRRQRPQSNQVLQKPPSKTGRLEQKLNRRERIAALADHPAPRPNEYKDSDLRLMSEVMEARQLSVARARGQGASHLLNQALTVSDIPMLVKLLQVPQKEQRLTSSESGAAIAIQ